MVVFPEAGAIMRRIRKWAKTFAYWDLLFSLAWDVLLVTFCLVFLVVVLIRGRYDQVPGLLGTALAGVAFLGFAAWVARDARRASRALRQRRKQGGPRPDGEMSDVAGKPDRPPWMG